MPKYNNSRKTWKYTNEFKSKAVQLSLLKGFKVKEAAKPLIYTLSCCHAGEINRIKRLDNENARLRQENDLLKKWQRFLAEEHQNDLDSSKDMG